MSQRGVKRKSLDGATPPDGRGRGRRRGRGRGVASASADDGAEGAGAPSSPVTARDAAPALPVDIEPSTNDRLLKNVTDKLSRILAHEFFADMLTAAPPQITSDVGDASGTQELHLQIITSCCHLPYIITFNITYITFNIHYV